MQKRGFLLIIFLILLAVPVYASCLGDFNNNGEVDNEDFGLFQSEYGKAVNEENKAYDLDNDGDIDFADFTLFSKEVGKTCGLAKPASQPINLVGGESEIKISGKLNNAYYDRPITNAVVEITDTFYGRKVTVPVDDNGGFSYLTVPGNFEVKITAEGYAEKIFTKNDLNKNWDFGIVEYFPENTLVISGYVMDSLGKPIPDTNVYLTSGYANELIKTDGFGNYRIPVRVSKPVFGYFEGGLEVKESKDYMGIKIKVYLTLGQVNSQTLQVERKALPNQYTGFVDTLLINKFDLLVIEEKYIPDSYRSELAIYRKANPDTIVTNYGGRAVYVFLPLKGWYENPVVTLISNGKVELWKNMVYQSSITLAKNDGGEFGNPDCRMKILDSGEGTVPVHICSFKQAAQAQQPVKSKMTSFNGHEVPLDVSEWECRDSSSALTNVPSSLPEETKQAILNEGGGWCSASPVKKDFCKDDFILVTYTCNDDCQEPHEIDCWEQNSQCVKDKCVKFENMGWSAEVLKNIKKLKDGDPLVESNAARALGKIKSLEVVPALIKVLETSKSEAVRLEAASALTKKTDSPEAVEALLIAIENDESPDVSSIIIRLLGGMNSPTVVSFLIRGLENSENPDTRYSIILALERLKPLEAIPPLIRVLENDENPNVRMQAASALGSMNSLEAVPALIRALENEKYSEVRLYVAMALGEINSPEAVPALIKALENDKDLSVRLMATRGLIKFGEYNLIGESYARRINNIGRESDASVEWLTTQFQESAVLINNIHDMENRREDTTRRTLIENLDARAVYYLLALGGADLYTSTFDLLYAKLTRNPDFLYEVTNNIDPNQEHTLGFVLTLSNFNKLKDIISMNPGFFMGAIKKALLEENDEKLRNNGVRLVSTIQAIFDDEKLANFKEEMETFLIEGYEKSDRKSVRSAILGYNIKLNKERFSEKNKEKARIISLGLPEILEPEVPEEWLQDGAITANLYFTQEGQLSRTRDQSFSKFFEFKVDKQEKKTSFLTVNPDSTIADGRISGGYNGVKLSVILTEDLDDVQQAVDDPSIDIIGHRGHSYNELNVFSPEIKSDESKLIFLGGCGGFGRVAIIQRTLPNAYFVSDENIGEGDANDRVLFYIMRSIALRSSQDRILWSEVEQDIEDAYAKLKAPYPSGIIFPHHKGLLLNLFIQRVLSRGG